MLLRRVAKDMVLLLVTIGTPLFVLSEELRVDEARIGAGFRFAN
jgi:hypothetical protein